MKVVNLNLTNVGDSGSEMPLDMIRRQGGERINQTVVANPGQKALLVRALILQNNLGGGIKDMGYLYISRDVHIGRASQFDKGILTFTRTLNSPIPMSQNCLRQG